MVIYSIYLFILEKKAFKDEMSAIKPTELLKCCFGSVPLFLYSPVISHKNINYFVMIDFALIAAFEMSFSLMPVFWSFTILLALDGIRKIRRKWDKRCALGVLRIKVKAEIQY